VKPEASELVGHVCTLLSLVEGTLDFLGKLEYGPGTPVEWQWLPTENFSNPGEKILKFGVPLERPGEFLVDLDQPLACLRTGAQNKSQGMGTPMENHRLGDAERAQHFGTRAVATHPEPPAPPAYPTRRYQE